MHSTHSPAVIFHAACDQSVFALMSSSGGELWAAAQVGFRDQKQVRKIVAVKRVNDVVNRLNRSKREAFPDLAAERDMYEKEVRSRAPVDKCAVRRGRSCMSQPRMGLLGLVELRGHQPVVPMHAKSVTGKRWV